MSWYYSSGSEQMGPVSREELTQLAAGSTVTADTLVWTDGMGNWKRYAEVTADSPPAMGARATGMAVCSQCGQMKPANELIEISGASVCGMCKPVAVQQLAEGLPLTRNAEDIRKAHIKHEYSIRSIGLLYYLGAIMMLVVGVGVSVAAVAQTGAAGPGGEMAGSLGVGIVFALLAFLAGSVGYGLRGLKRWTRLPVGILSGLGLLNVPVGTLINAYILYLIFSAKGKMVLSDEYAEVIRATPGMKYRTSMLVWVALGILLLAVAAIVIWAVTEN